MSCLNILCIALTGLTPVFGAIYEIKIQQSSLYAAISSQHYSLVCNISPQKNANDSRVFWKFSNGSSVPENDAFHSEGQFRQILVIRNVKQSYTGLQLVCVTTDHDSSTVESENYTLTVIAAPEIQFEEETIYSQSGKPFHKHCRAFGFPYPAVRWYQAHQEASQVTFSDHHSLLLVNEVGPELRFTCQAIVTHGSLRLTTNKTFILRSYDVENLKVADFFLTNADYKYVTFALNLLNLGLMILTLTAAIILLKWCKNGKRLKEHSKQKSIMLGELKANRETKVTKPSRPVKRSKTDVCRPSPQYLQFDDEKPLHFLYDEIRDVRVPTLPRKSTSEKESVMNMKNSYKIIAKARSKKQKYSVSGARGKTMTEPPSLPPQEYAGLKERTSGPNVYDEMNGTTKPNNLSTFNTTDSRLKSSSSSSYLEITADVDKQQTDSVIYSEVSRETAAGSDVIFEVN